MKNLKRLGLVLLVTIIIAVPLSSCSNGEGGDDVGNSSFPYDGKSEPSTADGAGGGATANSSSDPDSEQGQYIVRNGNIELVVEDVSAAGEQIEGLVEGLGGYVVSSRFWDNGSDLMGYYSVRVPDESFEAAMDALGNLAVEVKSESSDSYDVTQEYIDLDARLRNAEATESQYLTLLEKAASVQDTLEIYQALSQVRSTIEQLKGRIQYLETITSTSLINIYLEPEKSNEPLISGDWSLGDAFKDVIRGVVTFGQWLVTALMWVAIFSPIWGGLLIWFIIWRRKRQQAAS